VKIDAAAERCVNVLLELISTRVSYVVQEVVVVMKVRRLRQVQVRMLTLLPSGYFPEISSQLRSGDSHLMFQSGRVG